MPPPLDAFHPRHAGSPLKFTEQEKALVVPSKPRSLLLIYSSVAVDTKKVKDRPAISQPNALGNILNSCKPVLSAQAALQYFDANNVAIERKRNEADCLKALYYLIRQGKVLVYYWPFNLPIKLRPKPRLAGKYDSNASAPAMPASSTVKSRSGGYIPPKVPTQDEMKAYYANYREPTTPSHKAPIPEMPDGYCPVDKSTGIAAAIEGNPYKGLFKHYVSETTGGVIYGDTGSVNSLKLSPQDAADIRAFKEASPDGYAAATLIAPGSKLKKVGTSFIKKGATNDKITPSDLGKLKSLSSINPSKTVNGRKIVNGHLAGTVVKTKGGNVKFDKDGFPDFTPYSKKTVRVDGINGDMTNDVPLTMKKAGITTYDKKAMVWHHHQDGKTMMLIPRNVHSVKNGGVAHTGGRAVMQHNKNNPNNILNYASPKEVL